MASATESQRDYIFDLATSSKYKKVYPREEASKIAKQPMTAEKASEIIDTLKNREKSEAYKKYEHSRRVTGELVSRMVSQRI